MKATKLHQTQKNQVTTTTSYYNYINLPSGLKNSKNILIAYFHGKQFVQKFFDEKHKIHYIIFSFAIGVQPPFSLVSNSKIS